MAELKKDDLIFLPDFFANQYSSTYVKMTDNIECDEHQITDNAESIVRLIMSDYSQTISEAEKVVDDYLNLALTEIQNVEAEKLLDTFSKILCELHSFFSIKQKSEFFFKTESTDKEKHQKKRVELIRKQISPPMYLLIDQIISTLASRVSDSGNEDNADVHQLVEAYVRPVAEIIYALDGPWEISNKLRDQENILKEKILEKIIENSRNNTEEKIEAYYKDAPLDSIKEALDNLKTFVYILISPTFDINKFGDEYILEKFIANQSMNVQEKYRRIRTSMYSGDNKPEKFSFDDFEYKLRIVLPVISENKVNKNYYGVDNLIDVLEGNVEVAYRINCFEQLIYLFLKFLLHRDIKLKICKYCRQMFIPNHPNEKYCNRPLENHNGKTCREIGPSNSYEHDIFNHELKKKTQYFKMKILREKDPELAEKFNDKLAKWLKISKEIKTEYKSKIKTSNSRNKIKKTTNDYIKELNQKFQTILAEE